MEKSKVYFTKNITPEAMIQMYEALGLRLPGKVAVKVHSGEMGNQNFIRPEFMQPIIHHVKGTVVECNTAYEGKRNTTKEHWKTMASHGWTRFFQVDIMDEEGEMELPVSGGKQLSVNYVGDHLRNYDSVLVLSHFKGHPMGGFGGALKNISIGIAPPMARLTSMEPETPIKSGQPIMTPSWNPWPMRQNPLWIIKKAISPSSM